MTPGTISCDLCDAPLPEGRRYVKIVVPLPAELRAQLVAYFDKEIAPRMPTGPFSGMFGSESMVPNAWEIEVCVSCIFGLLPDLRSKIEAQVREVLQRKMAAKRNREVFAAEVDGDA